MIETLVIAMLVAVNALYVAAEFAAVSVRTSRIQQEADAGRPLARRLLPFLRDGHALDRYVAACQIGITISSLVVGAYGQQQVTPALAPVLEGVTTMDASTARSWAAIVVLIGLTVIQMVLGELVPKSLALQSPTRIALWTVVPMQWSLRLLAWLIRVLNGSGGLILRALRIPETGHRHVHSAEEIALLIAESADGGLIKPNEKVRLHQALRIGERPARELMVPRHAIVGVEADASLADVEPVVAGSPFTRFPVYEGTIDQVIGSVHARDVVLALGAPVTPPLRDLVSPIPVAPSTMNVGTLLARLRDEGRAMAILVDEYGGTEGLITIDNILDDLIGDIGDEFRPSTVGPERLSDDRVRLPGTLPVADAELWTGVRWKHRAATVGGLIMERLGRIPEAGDRLVIDGVSVEVERVARHVPTSVIVTTPAGRARRGDHG